MQITSESLKPALQQDI